MRKKSSEPSSKNSSEIEEIAERAQKGEDVSRYFTGKHVAKQRVNVDFPLRLLQQIDAECQRLGITRQAWIKTAYDERLRQVTSFLGQRQAS
jgi:hypothetical protein